MKTAPAFTIIIPTYNSRDILLRLLHSISKLKGAKPEVIVVDDGSTDDTAHILSDSMDVRYVRQENQGPAAARNHGAKLASGEILLFTDADCVLPEDFLLKYSQAFAKKHDANAIGGSYRTLNTNSRIARFIGNEIAYRHASRTRTRNVALGSYNVAFKKRVFDAVSGFNTSFPIASGEDFDLCYRMMESGAVLYFDNEIFVYHEHPDNMATYFRQQAKRGKTRMVNVLKHKKRAVDDGYVERSAAFQPILAIMLLAGTALLPFLQMSGLVTMTLAMILFWISNRQFLAFVRRDNDSALFTFGMCIIRATAWTKGVLQFLYWIPKIR